MMRTGFRSLLRPAARPSLAPSRTGHARRFITTEPPHLRSRSWKSSALRWGIAAAGIYYYTTSPVFAEQPEHNLLNPNVDALEVESPTLDALTASSRRKAQRDVSTLQSVVENASIEEAASQRDQTTYDHSAAPISNALIAEESPEALEEEAAGEGAFNPVTGEINWDCPCLGGMAYGPCGPQFREAFSCFVYSTEDPKGMDCIDKFQAMQNCFREHPEVYKGEIEDEEELDAELAQEREQLAKEIAERKKAVDEKAEQQDNNRLLEEPAKIEQPKKPKQSKKAKESESTTPRSDSTPQPKMQVAASSEPQPGMSADHEALSEGAPSPVRRTSSTKPIEPPSVVEAELIPKAAHDATDAQTAAK